MRLIDADQIQYVSSLVSRGNGMYENIMIAYKDQIDDIPTADPEHWIPCSERLPEPIDARQVRSWYMTTNNYYGVNITCYEFKNSTFEEGWKTDLPIIAWMPLPEPYKGEQE